MIGNQSVGIRYTIGPDIFFEDLLAEELRGPGLLPFPARVPREIRLRTRHERMFRRLRIPDAAVSGIGFREPDGYMNRFAKA